MVEISGRFFIIQTTMIITLHDAKDVVYKSEFIKLGQKTAVCLVTTKNGFEVIGSASVADTEDFDFETGKKAAYHKALQKIVELESYLRNETRDDQ